ncbi:MAG: thioredoxin family protein [Phycisphaerales bacterium]|jgi:peroxiredoxin|nr:MAG: thioredoxin family protein [Phycisphaerales bacterium]
MTKLKTTLFGSLALAAVAALASGSATLADHHGAPATAKVGEAAPDFTLTCTDGKAHTLSDYTKDGKIVVLEWFNVGCPFVVKHHERHRTMSTLAKDFKDKDVVWLAVVSSAPGTQGHGLELNREYKKKWEIAYPILIDEPGKVGRAYEARTTPHMYIIDKTGTLVYAGAIDNNRSATELGDVNYVRQALKQVVAGETVTESMTRPYGCSVKYAD